MDQEELHTLEEQCIQECAPGCTAACPLHVDVRAMVADLLKGSFSSALKTVRRALPFPGIIGRICEQPCQEACKRRDLGGSIRIAALERACAEFGGSAPERIKPLPSRGKKVAVVGGGLSGATAALDLFRKGYGVALFEARGSLGGRLWDLPEALVPRELIIAEFSLLSDNPLELHLNAVVGRDVSLEEMRSSYAAVYLGVGNAAPPQERPALSLNADGSVRHDPVTFETELQGVFAGGSLLCPVGGETFIGSVSTGRRAALSLDRYVQHASLTASRVQEGSYQTRLFTGITGIKPQPALPPKDAQASYTPEEAKVEAARCLQCVCLECVKVCAYLARFGGYPKKYIRQIYNNLSIVQGTRQANRFINSCSLCRLCYEVCPQDFDMARINRHARQTMVAQKRMPPSAHDFALRDMEFSNSEKFRLARHAPGEHRSGFAFFPGCQLAASAPEYVEKTYAYLRERLPEPVGLMLGCCGAPADWAGREDLRDQDLFWFTGRHHALGSPRLILACSTCYQVFRTFASDVPVVSLWEIFEQVGLPTESRPLPQARLALHDPCTTRYEPAMQASVRKILGLLGYEVEELPLSREKTECCSYGGLMWLANPDLAAEVVNRRVQESAHPYVTYCAVCRDFFASRGKPTLHLLDCIFGGGTAGLAERKGPGYSQRHENRARLKERLLRTYWGEHMAMNEPWDSISLAVAAEVQARLDERLILVEDVQKVIYHAEASGRKLINQQTGHFLACFRPTSVTYWVEYSAGPECFKVHNAYCHRMQVEEGRRP